jgi:hypothetical protein
VDVKAGVEDTYFVTTVNGRCIASFDERALAEDLIKLRTSQGIVSFRLFLRRTDTVELQLGVQR